MALLQADQSAESTGIVGGTGDRHLRCRPLLLLNDLDTFDVVVLGAGSAGEWTLAAHPRYLNQRDRAARVGHTASNPAPVALDDDEPAYHAAVGRSQHPLTRNAGRIGRFKGRAPL